jgi:uncharacterized protein with HEPN domain
VRESALAIQSFTAGMDLDAYAANAMAQAAVERKFEIIGEALNQLAKLNAPLAARIPDLAKIVAFRNQLIHGYATVKVSTVWNIAETALSTLINTVQTLMDEIQ